MATGLNQQNHPIPGQEKHGPGLWRLRKQGKRNGEQLGREKSWLGCTGRGGKVCRLRDQGQRKRGKEEG
jgi:hypothetical protein